MQEVLCKKFTKHKYLSEQGQVNNLAAIFPISCFVLNNSTLYQK